MDKPIKILVVEDEPSVRSGIEDNLKFEGYEVVCCDNGIDGFESIKTLNPDLVITDLMMPGMDGLELCKQIRSLEKSTPIIMLTAKCSEIDKVVGLEIGADDYLTKPFAMRELFARIRALLRRSTVLNRGIEKVVEENVTESAEFGSIKIDFKTYRAFKEESEIPMSAKEFELLKYLIERPDIPVSRNALLDEVWGYNSYPTTRTVDNFIARLRHKIEEVPDRPKHLLTVHGVGYKFVQ